MRFFIIFFVASLSGYAQEYRSKVYSLKDNFTVMPTAVIMEDSLGYLWIGSHGDGLFRFDGIEFINFTHHDGLPSNRITGLAQDRRGNIWICTSRGISKYNGIDFLNFYPSDLSAGPASQIHFSNDSIFFLIDGQLGKIYNDSIYQWGKQSSRDDVRIEKLLVDNKQNLITYSSNGILTRNSNKIDCSGKFRELYKLIYFGEESLLSTDSGLFKIANDRIERVFEDIKVRTASFDSSDSVFWIAPQFGLGSRKIKDGKLEPFVPFNTRSRIICAIQDSQGSIWCGTYENGIIRISKNEFVRMHEESVLDSSSIRGIYRDQRGNLWVGTFNNGVTLFRPDGQAIRFSTVMPGQNNVMTINGNNQGQVFVGTLGGLLIYDLNNQKTRWLTTKTGLKSDSVTSLEVTKDDVMLIGSFSPWLLSYRDNTISYELLDSINNLYSISACPSCHGLYLVGKGGAFYKNGSVMKKVKIPIGEELRVLNCRVGGDSLLFFGTLGGGLIIRPINSDKFYSITKRNGLLSDNVAYATYDLEGFLWIGTDKGANRVRLGSDYKVTEIYSFGEHNGFEGQRTNASSILITKNEILLGSSYGLFKFAGHAERISTPNRLHLTDLKITGRKMGTGKSGSQPLTLHKPPKNPVLNAGDNSIIFSFNKVDKINPLGIRYSYILDNYDSEWSEPSGERKATYNNLPAGMFTFKVKAFLNGTPIGHPLHYSFSVVRPFYATWWFLSLSVLILLVMITGVVYWRVRHRMHQSLVLERVRVEEQNRIKKEIARDYHDELGNRLAKIINYTNVIRYTRKLDEEILKKMEQTAQSLHLGAKDFIWTIDPANDELTHLFLYIRDFGEKMFSDHGVAFRAFNKVKTEMPLPHGLGREVILIFKEAITNSYAHAHAKNVLFQLAEVERGVFEFSLKDDGIGFEQEKIEVKRGLMNMTVRANRIGGSLIVSSNESDGTEIKLNIELRPHNNDTHKKKSLFN